MTEHLDRHLNRIRQGVLQMGERVGEAVERALRAYERADADLAAQVIEADDAIDQLELDLEEQCLETLVLEGPVAPDLRYVLAVMRINNDLERIGDLAVNIAKRAAALTLEPPLDAIPLDLSATVERTSAILRDALAAIVESDIERARLVRSAVREVDPVYREVAPRIEEAIRLTPDRTAAMLSLMSISMDLARMGGIAADIAGEVIFLVGGEMPRRRPTL